MAGEGALAGYRVLLVDDSDIVLDVIGDKLACHGCEVVKEISPKIALDLAIAEGTVFDLFILDVLMPDMSGYELTTWLRQHPSTRNTPILLLTSLDSEDATLQGLEAGADDFITKQVSDAEILARVRSLISLGKLRDRMATHRKAMTQLFTPEAEPESIHEAERRLKSTLVVHEVRKARASLVRVLSGLEHDVQAVDRVKGIKQEIELGTDLVVGSYDVLVDRSSDLLDYLEGNEMTPALVVYDDQPSIERRIAAFDANTDDYISADVSNDEVAARILTALKRRQRSTALRTERDHAVLAAITDPLTRLYNRGYFNEVLRLEVARAQRYMQPLTLIMLDIDRFKRINDHHGHPVGDEVLTEVARRIGDSMRVSDLAARYGGEEFAVILPQSELQMGARLGERIRQALSAKPIAVSHGSSFEITASIGVACSSGTELSGMALLQKADEALYAAKRAGRDRVVCSGDATTEGAEKAPADKQRAHPSGDPVAHVTSRIDWLLSDDLDSPLTSLRAAAALLLQSVDDDSPSSPMIQRLVDSGVELAEILQELSKHLGPGDRMAQVHTGTDEAVSGLSFKWAPGKRNPDSGGT